MDHKSLSRPKESWVASLVNTERYEQAKYHQRDCELLLSQLEVPNSFLPRSRQHLLEKATIYSIVGKLNEIVCKRFWE